MKTRISKKSLAAMPPVVAEQVKAMAERHGIKSFSHGMRAANMVHQGQPAFGLYLSEGSRFSVVYRDEAMSVQVVSENTMGASGVSYEVGKTAPIPVDATVIEVGYYGDYWMSIFVVTPMALKGNA